MGGLFLAFLRFWGTSIFEILGGVPILEILDGGSVFGVFEILGYLYF